MTRPRTARALVATTALVLATIVVAARQDEPASRGRIKATIPPGVVTAAEPIANDPQVLDLIKEQSTDAAAKARWNQFLELVGIPSPPRQEHLKAAEIHRRLVNEWGFSPDEVLTRDDGVIPTSDTNIVTNTTDVFSLAIINGGGGSGCRYGFFSEFSGKIDISAGVDQNICANETVALSGSVSGGSTTGIWTSNGSGVFNPSATALNATYEPSIGDIALGTVTLTLTSTGNCTPVEDEMVVTIAPRPLPDAGPDQLVCGTTTWCNWRAVC